MRLAGRELHTGGAQQPAADEPPKRTPQIGVKATGKTLRAIELHRAGVTGRGIADALGWPVQRVCEALSRARRAGWHLPQRSWAPQRCGACGAQGHNRRRCYAVRLRGA